MCVLQIIILITVIIVIMIVFKDLFCQLQLSELILLCTSI